MNHLPCGVLMTHFQSRSIDFVNDYLKNQIQFDPCENVPLTMESLFSKASLIFLDTYIYPTLLKVGYAEEAQLTIKRAYGGRIPVVVNIKRDEDILYWTFFSAVERDRLYEDLIVARDEAADALKAAKTSYEQQQNILKIISHQVRTPLATISMLVSESNDMSADDKSALLRENANYLITLMENLKPLVNPDSDSYQELVNINLAELIDQVRSSMFEKLTANNITYHFNESRLASTPIKANRRAIKQVLNNLISNACIHSDGNNIWINISHSVVDPVGEIIAISVRDDGRGILAKDAEKIFEMFVRVDTQADGMGVGLSVSLDIAKAQGGNIEYRSAEPQGSEFIYSFINQLSRPPTLEIGVTKPTFEIKDLRILVVEDNKTIALLTQKILEKNQAVVILASDGQEALDCFEASQIDLVLTDIHMPIMDGYKLIEALKAQEIKCPIIAVTAAGLGDEMDTALKLGADAVIGKPLTTEKLVEKLLLIYGNRISPDG